MSIAETPACTPTTQKSHEDANNSTQVTRNSATLSNPEEQEVSKLHSSDQDTVKNVCSDDCEFNCEKGELKDLDAVSEEVHVDKKKTDMQKHEIIENLNLTPINSMHVGRLNKRNSRASVTVREQKKTGKKHEDTAVEYSRTRPERKRRLTTKMKESELSETLRFANRKPSTQSIDENESVKPRKSNRKGKIDKSKDDEHDNIRLRRSDKQTTADELNNSIDKERKLAKTDNTSNTLESDLCSEEILMTEDSVSAVGFTVHEQNIKSVDKEAVKSDDSQNVSFDSDTCSVSFQDDINAGEKSIKNLRKKHRRKKLDDEKLPVYKRKDFKCGVCGKVGSMNMIKYHQQMHSNKMPYKCEVCGKCFKTAACKRVR